MMTTPTTQADETPQSPTAEAGSKAEDRLFLALLSSDMPMPNGGWYTLIDEAGAEAAAASDARENEVRSQLATVVEALQATEQGILGLWSCKCGWDEIPENESCPHWKAAIAALPGTILSDLTTTSKTWLEAHDEAIRAATRADFVVIGPDNLAYLQGLRDGRAAERERLRTEIRALMETRTDWAVPTFLGEADVLALLAPSTPEGQ